MAKYYYNGILLPEIPADVLESFPYCWINSTGSAFIVAAYPWYYTSGKMNIAVSAENRKYSLSSDGMGWELSKTYTDTGGYTVNAPPTWANHDIPNGSATSTTIYFYATDPVPENEVKPKKLIYDVYTDFYTGENTIYYEVGDLTINYAVPVKKYSTYTVTMTEVGNRLRAVYTMVDPATITANTAATDIVMNPSFSAGYTFNYLAQADGWMVVYVSNAGERPKISIVTNGAGGDGAPLYDLKYLVRSGSTLYTITDGALTALTESEVTASLFQTYGLDELPDGSLLLSLTDPEVLYWHDSTDELPALTIRVTGSPPVPQTVITGSQDMSDPTILGIESASVDASDDVLFAMSFDDGATWKAYSGTGWVTLETENAGMTKATMENIGLEAWAEVVTSDSYRVRFTLVSADSYVAWVVIHYINEESEEESNA